MTLPLDESRDVADDRTMTDSAPHILVAVNAVMKDVTVVGKDGFNQKQQYRFRGIDGVIDAVGPAFRDHGVIPTFKVVSIERREYESKNKAQMMETLVEVDYTFTSMVDGSSITCYSVPGEASDSSDKGASKAMSVAYRVALIQALAIPTNQPDPDEETHERATKAEPEAVVLLTADQADLMSECTASLSEDSRSELNSWYKGQQLPKKERLSEQQAEMVLLKMSALLTAQTNDELAVPNDVDPETGEKIVNPIDARLDGSDALNEPF